MNREEGIQRLADTGKIWDVLIIGGGATGLGAAVEAASRGYSTLLVEQVDFAKGTSSRATKLAHGGVRYLQQGNVSLVYHALRERGLMVRNVPHIAHTLDFVIPIYTWWGKLFYGFGMKVYDALSGKLSLGPSRILNREETVKRLPTVNTQGLRGGVLYTDGQFDDSRLAATLAMTAIDHQAVVLNYMQVISLQKEGGKVSGAVVKDVETGLEYPVRARSVLNATGIFTDTVRRLDDAAAKTMLSVSQGTHIVLDRSFLPGDAALMVPHTDDGRVLFGVPWHEHVIVGTTDLPTPHIVLEPRAMQEEIDFLLRYSEQYFGRPVRRSDVQSIFSGLRPLISSGHGEKTSALSRDHTVIVSPTKLVTITGGKWTSYRKMGEDAVDHLIEAAGLEAKPSRTVDLHLHGYKLNAPFSDPHSVYGTDYDQILSLATQNPELNQLLHKRLPYTVADVIWAIREEMARTVEDVLARRTHSLLLNARASKEVAPEVARLLARELKRDSAWEQSQVDQFNQLADGYLLN